VRQQHSLFQRVQRTKHRRRNDDLAGIARKRVGNRIFRRNYGYLSIIALSGLATLPEADTDRGERGEADCHQGCKSQRCERATVMRREIVTPRESFRDAVQLNDVRPYDEEERPDRSTTGDEYE